MKNVLICGAGMSATDLISYMLKHAEEYNWDVTEDNIALTSGSQSAFFSLFNIFGGRDDDGNIASIFTNTINSIQFGFVDFRWLRRGWHWWWP